MKDEMYRKLSFLLLVMLMAACAPVATASPTPAVDTLEQEEQAVYATLLKQTYTAPMLVIMALTSTGPGEGVDNTEKTLAYVLQNMHDVDQATVDSFRSRNASAYPIPADMDLGIPYSLITQVQRKQIFGPNQSGWEVFYSNYPNSPGITTLSRVGFNAAFDQALIYLGTESNWLAGIGNYILMKKVEGDWMIDQQVRTWIS
jgi:hypothetical protein